ncbi:MAG: hypothetical protein LKM44_01090 [Wolbachia endosymbiont of Meromenopon meropis]|nr:hypothetical protein [Wolbachia endosymbiont of Meromenopon meropis]
MSTNWFHDFFFGSNKSAIDALEKFQSMDIEQFQKIFSTLKKIQEVQYLSVEQIQTGFNRLKKLQEGQLFNSEQIESMQEYLNKLQEKFCDVEEKVETLTETLADQEKIILACCIVASVVAVAAVSFIGFCIYHGIKSEREKQKTLFQDNDASTQKFIDLYEPYTEFDADINSIEKLSNSLRVK